MHDHKNTSVQQICPMNSVSHHDCLAIGHATPQQTPAAHIPDHSPLYARTACLMLLRRPCRCCCSRCCLLRRQRYALGCAARLRMHADVARLPRACCERPLHWVCPLVLQDGPVKHIVPVPTWQSSHWQGRLRQFKLGTKCMLVRIVICTCSVPCMLEMLLVYS